MSSSSIKAEPCGHTLFYEGCLSCCAHDFRKDLREATDQKAQRDAMIAGLDGLLAQPYLPPRERLRQSKKRVQAEAQREKWDKRSQVLARVVEHVQEGVDEIAKSSLPSDLTTRFEDNALERTLKSINIWRAAATNDDDEGSKGWKPENPECKLEFEGLDYLTIEATPDVLVLETEGLQCYLRAGRTLPADTRRQPRDAVGERNSPAVMSLGRALELFRFRSSSENTEAEQDSASALVGDLESCKIGLSSKMTEQKRRQELADIEPMSTPILNEEDQWRLFTSSEHMLDAAILANEYKQLVARKVAHEKAVEAAKLNAELEAELAASQGSKAKAPKPVELPVLETDGWPPVDHLDWAGLTNWIHRCREATSVADFKATMRTWKAERTQRKKKILAAIQAWKPSDTEYDDVARHYPDPKRYFTTDKWLGDIDSKIIDRQG